MDRIFRLWYRVSSTFWFLPAAIVTGATLLAFVTIEADAVIEPGMVFTIEPGLYFKAEDLAVPEQYRGIGVRIEDDVLVTADGNENLTAALPRTPDALEAWMASVR